MTAYSLLSRFPRLGCRPRRYISRAICHGFIGSHADIICFLSFQSFDGLGRPTMHRNRAAGCLGKRWRAAVLHLISAGLLRLLFPRYLETARFSLNRCNPCRLRANAERCLHLSRVPFAAESDANRIFSHSFPLFRIRNRIF